MKHSKQPKAKKFHLPHKDREFLTANLSALLKAGVPVGETLASLEETSKSPVFKKAMQQMQRDIDNGSSLSEALRRSGIATEQTLALITLGERSGTLTENLEVAAAQEEKQNLFRAKVRSALLYPVFVLGLTAVVGMGVAWFLLPRLSDTFSQLNVQLPFISKVFINAGVFLKQHGTRVVPAVIAGILLLFYVVFSFPPTRRMGNALLFHIPGIARLLQEVEIARFGYLLGTLLQAGLSVTDALALLAKSTRAHRYQVFYAYLARSFEEGYGFAANLRRYKKASLLLPATVQQMIIAGERSGALPETLHNIGNRYEAKADVTTNNLEVILEPMLLVIVALSVLGVAIAVILPIYKLVGGLS
jgi:type IV pilus assembly protein PilC